MKPVAVALATPVAGLTSQPCMFASTCGNWLVGGGGGGGGGQQQQQQQYRLSCSSLSSCSQVQFVNASLCSVTTCGNGAGHSLVVQEVSAAASQRMAVQSCDSSFAAGCSGLRRVGRGMDSGGRLNGGGCGHYRLARLRCLGSGDLSNNNNNSSNGPSERASRRDGASEGEAETGNGGGMEEEVASSSVWDLQARRKRMQAAAAKMGDPLLNMMSNASKKLQDYLDNYKQTRAKDTASVATTGSKEVAGVALETKWEQWQKVFAEAEEQESLATVLRFQMEEAVAIEDFQEAARLKGALDAVTATDTVAEVMVELKRALEEERYSDAALYRDEAGAGLVGWWAGLAEGENDPYGRIIKIYPAHGRLVAKGFSARQLATAAEGAALFEVFITKEGDRDFQQQAVYLQREFNVAESSAGLSKSMDLNMLDLENLAEDSSSRDLKRTKDLLKDESGENKGKVEDAVLSDEGLDKIMSFLKNRMPHVKLKVFKVIALEESEADIPKIVEKMMEAEEESRKQEDAGESNTTTRNGENAVGNKFPLDGKIPVGSRSSTIGEEEEKDNPIRLVVGGVLQNSVDSAPPRLPVRVPARLEPTSRNSFNFHIEDADNSPAGAPLNEVAPSWKVATIATQAAADLMPDDVAKVLWNVEKVPVKVSKEIADIIRLAISQVQRRQGLFKCTSFSRINISKSSTDPLSGLYIGAFGPYTSEVVQLHRKYGHWENEQTSSSGQNLEFFEYVEAVKLTGDLNVPAGQVTFRARIGSESRFSHRGVYPEELGVVARYEGQGRLAEPGFRNPQWINGELVLLDGKGGNHTNGAALGFVYSVPERHFLVLFKRLCLSD